MEEKKRTGYPSVDKPWLKYYSEEAINAKLPECTIYENIWQHNRDYLNDVALEYYGCKTSYRKLFFEVEHTAKALRQAGVQKGECVTLCTAGVPEAVYTVLACSRIGAVANFINPMFTTEQMIDRVNDTKARILIVLDAMYCFIADTVDKTCVERVIVVPATGSLPAPVRALAWLKSRPDQRLRGAMRSNEKYVPWSDFIRAGAVYSGEIDAPYEKDRPVVMVYSSGTTGASKGIVLTNDGINATINHYESPGFPYHRGTTFLQIIPVWFSTGIVLSVLMPLCMGVAVIPEPNYKEQSFVAAFCRYKPNMTLATTSFWVYAIKDKRFNAMDLSGLLYPITGGEQMLPRVERLMNDFLTRHGCKSKLIIGWGMCELGNTISSTSAIHGVSGSVGYPITGTSVLAYDVQACCECPYNQRGELRVSSAGHM